MEVQTKVLSVSVLWCVFWWIVLTLQARGNPVAYRTTSYGDTAANMLMIGLIVAFVAGAVCVALA